MSTLQEWLPVLLSAASAITVVVTLRAQQKFSAWRHDVNEKRLDAHDARIRTNETHIAVLNARAGTSPPNT